MIERFLTYIRCELNYSAYTVRSYESDLMLLADFITGGKPQDFRPEELTLNDLRSWIASQAERGLAPRTLRRRTLAARALLRFMRKKGEISRNPASDLPLPHLPSPLPTFVRETEMEQILRPEEFDTQDFIAFRDKLIIEILYTTGLRRSELLALQWRDIDTAKGEMKVTGKRNKQRIVPLHPHLCEHIEKYARLRTEISEDAIGSVGADSSAPFLTNERGEAVNNYALSRIVKIQLSSTSGAKKTPHVLRHSCATALLRHDARLDSVKELLGHSSLATTQIYTHLSFSELQHNYELAHPRAAKSKHHGSTD